MIAKKDSEFLALRNENETLAAKLAAKDYVKEVRPQ